MNLSAVQGRLSTLSRSPGCRSRCVRLAIGEIGLDGLDDASAGELERRWGPFLVEAPGSPVADRVVLVDAGESGWLPRWEPGERYRLEWVEGSADPLVVSYHFALCADAGESSWKLAVTSTDDEPRGRIVENALRYVAARRAIRQGGFALHAAAVERDGHAYLLAGPSNAGKTTAVSQLAAARSLGDDFAVVVRDAGRWATAALPFDNSERIVEAPVPGLIPVAGLFRLRQDAVTRIDRPPALLALSSLMGCVAFPWALPDRTEAQLDHVRDLVSDGLFGELHFARQVDLWTHLLAACH